MSSRLHPYIDSVKHEALLKVRDFQSKKARNNAYTAVLDGHKELEWALEHNAHIAILIATEQTADSAAVIACEQQNTSIFICRDSIFKRYFSSTDDDAIAALVTINHATLSSKKNIALLLEDVIDPGNIGTIIRSARSFGVVDFYANNMELDWFSKKSIKASRGSHFASQFHSFLDTEEAIEQLKAQGYQIIGTSPHAKDLISLVDLEKKPCVIIVGNEQNGLSEKALNAADLLVRIPMMSDVESLNVAVATGISIYELYFRLVFTMLTKNIESNLGRNIGILFQLFPRVLNQDLAHSGTLNANQVIFLMILKMDGSMTREQINEDLARLGEELTTLDELTKSNLIEEKNNAFSLTHQGEQMLAKLWMIVENAETKIMSVLSEQEQSELRSMLMRLEHQCVDLLTKKKAS